MEIKSKILILSSSEGLPVARSVQASLEKLAVQSEVWDQGVFPHGEVLLNSLIKILPECSETVVIVTPDDIVQSRGASAILPRDNIILEIGLCIGMLGTDHTHIFCPLGASVKLPSDLNGLTFLTFDNSSTEETSKSIEICCDRLMKKIVSRPRFNMRWDVFGGAVRKLSDMVMRNEHYGGFRPSIVVGVNPGGAIVGSVLYYLNRDSFHFTTLWAADSTRLLPNVPALQELVNRASTEKNDKVKILLVDDGAKTGANLRRAESFINKLSDNYNITFKSAVLLWNSGNANSNNDWRPDYYIFDQFTHLPYAEL